MQSLRKETYRSSNKNKKDDELNNNHGKEELKSFAQDTTLHGARFLFSDNVFRRLLWTFTVIACFTYCIYQVYTSVSAFYDRPFITKISRTTSKEVNELHFPAVSICNHNPLNKRRYRNSFKKDINETLIEKKIQAISLLSSTADEIFKTEFKRRNPELFTRLKTATGTLNIKGNLSHQIGEMLLPRSSQFYSCIHQWNTVHQR